MPKGKKEKIVEILPPPLPETPPEPKPLTEDALYFWTDIPERIATTVPPPTPAGVDNVVILPFPIPETFPSLDVLDIPFVRDIGIKASIELLGQHLGLTNYTFDYIQFWLLDVLVDCLWRAQDEYFLTKPDQKLVLEWMLYMFRVMRDPTISFSRKQLLKLFKEAILMTGQLIQEGHKVIPKPDDLFELVFQNNAQREHDKDEIVDEETTISSVEEEESQSESTFTISKTNSEHIILMDIGGQQRKYALKQRVCSCEQGSTPTFGTTFTTDITKSTEVSLVYDSYTDEEEGLEGEQMFEMEPESIETYVEPFPNKDYKVFHVVDDKLPSRFAAIIDDQQTTEILKRAEDQPDYEPPCAIIGDIVLVDNKSSTITSTTETTSAETLKTDSQLKDKSQSAAAEESVLRSMTYDEKMKLWRQFKQREQEIKDMDDPNVGVVPVHHHHHAHLGIYGTSPDKPKPLGSALKDQTENMLRQMLADMQNDENEDDQESCGLDFEHKTKNLSILCAIIDFVFDYFYQNFHFTLLKLALKTNPSIITQKINPEWYVPKFNLVELVKPKPTPQKKEKKAKDKAEKKDKKSKPDKKSKDKKKDKSDKKKEKKEKPKKPTKEELKAVKAEQERQRLLQEQLEEEMRKQEENRRCMFPLADAATDELYMGLFENWEKPKEGKDKGGKGKKK